MGLGLKIDAAKLKHGIVKIRALDPHEHPEVLRRALPKMMDLVLDESRAHQLSGPRPRELDQVTGELAASLTKNESALPFGISGGTPLPWAPVHEFGRHGLHSFLEPALDTVLPRLPEVLEREWLEVFDAA